MQIDWTRVAVAVVDNLPQIITAIGVVLASGLSGLAVLFSRRNTTRIDENTIITKAVGAAATVNAKAAAKAATSAESKVDNLSGQLNGQLETKIKDIVKTELVPILKAIEELKGKA